MKLNLQLILLEIQLHHWLNLQPKLLEIQLHIRTASMHNQLLMIQRIPIASMQIQLLMIQRIPHKCLLIHLLFHWLHKKSSTQIKLLTNNLQPNMLLKILSIEIHWLSLAGNSLD